MMPAWFRSARCRRTKCSESRSVGGRLPDLAGIGEGDHVVPDPTQCFDDREREVLVGEEARHRRLRAFVVADLSIDLVPVTPHVRPGAGKISCHNIPIDRVTVARCVPARARRLHLPPKRRVVHSECARTIRGRSVGSCTTR